MLSLRPGELRRKREDDFGQVGLAVFAGYPSIKKDFFNLQYKCCKMRGFDLPKFKVSGFWSAKTVAAKPVVACIRRLEQNRPYHDRVG